MIGKLEGEKDALEQLAVERETTAQALRAQFQAEHEHATAAQAKATQLEARVVDLKDELDRALKQIESEQRATQAAREEAKSAVIETARLTGVNGCQEALFSGCEDAVP